MEPFARLPKRILQDDQLSAKARLLYAALDGHLDKRTGECAPTLERLAGQLGWERTTVIRHLRILELAGLIEVIRVSGKRNRYTFLTIATGCSPATGSDRATGCNPATGTSCSPATGQANSPYRSFQEQEKEGAPPPPERETSKGQTQPSLFGRQQRDWLRSAVEYFLDEQPDDANLAAMRSWYPALVAEFFLLRSWQKLSDPGNAFAWARQFARLQLTEAEARAAFDFAATTPPTDARGGRLFGRPDYFNHILAHVQAQRRSAKAQSLRPAEPAGSEADRLWAQASDAEREAIRAEVRLSYSGPASFFEAACKRELMLRSSGASSILSEAK